MSTRAPYAGAASAPEDEPQTRDAAAEHARLLEHLVGAKGILTAYAEDLASIRRQAAELRVKNRRMLEQVRELQTRPSSRNGTRSSESSRHSVSATSAPRTDNEVALSRVEK